MCRSCLGILLISSFTLFPDVPCGVFGLVTETPGLFVEVWMHVCMCVLRAKRLRGGSSRIIIAV